MKKLIQIDPSKVLSVYSGRQGCACGCRGKHTYASAHRAFSGKNRGYAVADTEVNDRTVKLIINKVQAHIVNGVRPTSDWFEKKTTKIWGRKFVSVDVGNRTYIVYQSI